jgi:hypothetical protein
MSRNGTEAIVTQYPACDIHKLSLNIIVPAAYDAKTTDGPWAFLCEEHFQSHTTGDLGVGHGQRLVLKEDD